jgi:hypothetical protein
MIEVKHVMAFVLAGTLTIGAASKLRAGPVLTNTVVTRACTH